jgi:phospholipid/cholesterol/gamma-HCH transport system ATP-binding protein
MNTARADYGCGDTLISVRDLHKSFAGKPVLQGVDLEIGCGETLVVLGSSGAGKSVLLRHLNGLLRPDRGAITINGTIINSLSEVALIEVRKKVAMVFQQGALFDSMTVFENISYPLVEHTALDDQQIADRVRELLEMVELTGAEGLYPSELSGGMRKRVALARAIALNPKAILYDEPTTGLDPIVTNRINQLIRGLQQKFGFTSVVVTHDLKSALAVGDRFVFLDGGKIRFSGSADDVLNPCDEVTKNFVSAAR